jgi:hypothetical protein
MTEQPQTESGDVFATPIGMSVPADGEVSYGIPLPLWELHSVESWAKALLADLLEKSSRPIQPPPGHDIPPAAVGQREAHMNISFLVTRLEDGHMGVSASVKQPAPGGRFVFVHHLVKLDVVAPEIPPYEKPGSERT